MMRLEDIRDNEDLLNAIDWDMTPEEAVRLYLEWGNNWAGQFFSICFPPCYILLSCL